jgi:hypothetical protein
MNPNKLDEYAMWPRDPQPLFVRTAEYLGETQIDIRKKEMSSRYERPPWKPVNEKQFDVRLSAFGPETSSERYRSETARTFDEDGRIEDGRQSRICYRQRRAHDQEKNSTSKHGVQCGAVCNY